MNASVCSEPIDQGSVQFAFLTTPDVNLLTLVKSSLANECDKEGQSTF